MARNIMDVVLSKPEIWAEQMRQAQAAGYIPGNRVVSYEEMRRFNAAGSYSIEISTTEHADIEVDGIDTILPFLAQRHWRCLMAKMGRPGRCRCRTGVLPERRISEPGAYLAGAATSRAMTSSEDNAYGPDPTV